MSFGHHFLLLFQYLLNFLRITSLVQNDYVLNYRLSRFVSIRILFLNQISTRFQIVLGWTWLVFFWNWLFCLFFNNHNLFFHSLLTTRIQFYEILNFTATIRARMLILFERRQTIETVAVVATRSNDVWNVFDFHAHLALTGASHLFEHYWAFDLFFNSFAIFHFFLFLHVQDVYLFFVFFGFRAYWVRIILWAFRVMILYNKWNNYFLILCYLAPLTLRPLINILIRWQNLVRCFISYWQSFFNRYFLNLILLLSPPRHILIYIKTSSLPFLNLSRHPFLFC